MDVSFKVGHKSVSSLVSMHVYSASIDSILIWKYEYYTKEMTEYLLVFFVGDGVELQRRHIIP
jgi:hypothetical protein